MSTEEKIKDYISKTLRLAYEMTADNRFFEMLGLIFEYGMSKGYRKAKKDRVKHERNQSPRGT